MTLTDYLEREFRRYFADSEITVDDLEPEMIHVHVVTPTPGVADHFRLVSYVCEIGSDDDYYVFVSNLHNADFDHYRDLITIPLMPESEAC